MGVAHRDRTAAQKLNVVLATLETRRHSVSQMGTDRTMFSTVPTTRAKGAGCGPVKTDVRF